MYTYNSHSYTNGDAEFKPTSTLTFSSLKPGETVRVVVEGHNVYETKTVHVKLSETDERICIPWFDRQTDDNRNAYSRSIAIAGAPVFNERDELVGTARDWNTEYSIVEQTERDIPGPEVMTGTLTSHATDWGTREDTSVNFTYRYDECPLQDITRVSNGVLYIKGETKCIKLLKRETSRLEFIRIKWLTLHEATRMTPAAVYGNVYSFAPYLFSLIF
jgi:hypothetical protein